MMENNLKDEIRILQDERDKRIEDAARRQDRHDRPVTTRGDKVVKKGQELTRETLRASCATPTS